MAGGFRWREQEASVALAVSFPEFAFGHARGGRRRDCNVRCGNVWCEAGVGLARHGHALALGIAL